MRIKEGSIWRNTVEGDELFGKLCLVKEVHDKPEYNGDGDIELLYEDGSGYTGKVRRFDYRHEFVTNDSSGFVVKPSMKRELHNLQTALGHLQNVSECKISRDMVDGLVEHYASKTEHSEVDLKEFTVNLMQIMMDAKNPE